MSNTEQTAWDIFDALPADIKRAHQTVYTGTVVFENQYSRRLMLTNIDHATAEAILSLDDGKYMVGAVDLCGKPRFV